MLNDTSLITELKIKNSGSQQFDFTTLLHTYIKVSSINKTFVSGFNGCEFVDKVSKYCALLSRKNF